MSLEFLPPATLTLMFVRQKIVSLLFLCATGGTYLPRRQSPAWRQGCWR